MIPRIPVIPRVLVAAGTLAAVLAACGGDGGSAPDLSPAGKAGHQVMRDSGCAACHGGDGEGGVGPAFVDLYGTEVELEDGTTVIADDAYLERAIREPGAERVDDYRMTMPPNNLSDDEIASILDYIRELGAQE